MKLKKWVVVYKFLGWYYHLYLPPLQVDVVRDIRLLPDIYWNLFAQFGSFDEDGFARTLNGPGKLQFYFRYIILFWFGSSPRILFHYNLTLHFNSFETFPFSLCYSVVPLPLKRVAGAMWLAGVVVIVVVVVAIVVVSTAALILLGLSTTKDVWPIRIDCDLCCC